MTWLIDGVLLLALAALVVAMAWEATTGHVATGLVVLTGVITAVGVWRLARRSRRN